jgi:hypothetical protein
MADVDQIRNGLSEWMDGKITLREFEDWFVPATWDIHQSGDEKAEDLADEIELRLSEYSGGYLSREDLRSEMKSLLAQSCPILTFRYEVSLGQATGLRLASSARPFYRRLAQV